MKDFFPESLGSKTLVCSIHGKIRYIPGDDQELLATNHPAPTVLCIWIPVKDGIWGEEHRI